MKSFPMFGIVLAACLASAGRSSADVIYAQNGLTYTSGMSSQNDTSGTWGPGFFTAFDNFTLSTTSQINAVHWVGGSAPSTTSPITQFTIGFWSDAGGPGGSPGTLLATNVISGNANQTFILLSSGNNYYSYDGQLTSAFNANGGTMYWMSIVPDMAYSPGTNQWFWADVIGGPGDGDNWLRSVPFSIDEHQGFDLAFSLSDNSIAAVAEPSTFALTAPLLWLGFIVWRHRRR